LEKYCKKKTGLKYSISFFDEFTSLLSSIKNKNQDITYSVGKTKDREEYAIFTKPYISFPLSIVTLKDEHFIENMEYLFDKKIAVGDNFTAHKILKENYPKLDFLLVSNIKEGLKAVKDKKAYAFIDIKPNLSYNIKKLHLDELKISGNTGLDFELRIMIRDDYKILQSILDKAISKLDEKELNNIVQNGQILNLKIPLIILIFG
jgi:ABC-type amino acid transport substrate-binding protein